MSHMRLLSPIRDWSVPQDHFVLQNTALSHMRLPCATWGIAMSLTRLLFPIWDWSVPHETGLSHMILICPTWEWSVSHETALSHMTLLQMYFLKHKELCVFFLSCICPSQYWSMGRDWDGTGTRLRLGQCKTVFLSKKVAKSRLKSHIKYINPYYG